MLYFDTSYIARLYLLDPGWEKVRALAATDHLSCCLLGRAETVASFHRKFREKQINRRELQTAIESFDRDCASDAFRWLPLAASAVARLTAVFANLPAPVALRASEGIHLACAAEAGFSAIYSNDTRLLEAAPHFSLSGKNII